MKTLVTSSEILSAIERAPRMSVSASKLLSLTGGPNHHLVDVVEIVRHDSVLTVHILKTVNSVAFSLLQEVTSIDHAISFLGEKMLVGIAIEVATSRLFSKTLDGYGGEPGDLWRHDLRCAIAAEEIAKLKETRFSKDLAFTGGILHDIGKSIISDFLRDTATGALSQIEEGAYADYLAAEQDLLGTDHALVGEALAVNWNLPEALRQVIRYHHHPSEASEAHRPLVYAVHLGDLIAMMGGCGTGADTLRYPLDERYKDYLDLSEADMDMIMIHVEESYQKIAASMADGKGAS
jgi:putative nucleotidyltransferase with HDIG domain